jgi:TfoX/Sxy family transcriptional regulator of competence genes
VDGLGWAGAVLAAANEGAEGAGLAVAVAEPEEPHPVASNAADSVAATSVAATSVAAAADGAAARCRGAFKHFILAPGRGDTTPPRDNARMAYDEDLANRIRELILAEDGVTEKRMFGGLAFLINGNMSVSASGQGGLLLRVDPAETDALLGQPHAQPFAMRGRVMQGWLRVEAEGVQTRRQLERWVARGVAYARSLPPKKG